MKAGRYNEAMAALAKQPDQARSPRLALAAILARIGNPPAARFHLERAAADHPNAPDVYQLNGEFAIAEGRVTDGVLSFEKALALADDEPTRRAARLGLASAYELRPDWSAALAQLAAVLDAGSDDMSLRNRLAVALFHTGKPDAALTEFRTVAAADPKFGPPELRMALLWTGQDDAAQAEEWFRKAVDAHPKDPEPARAFAGWLLDAGRPADAAPLVATVEKLDPDSRATRTLRGVLARYTRDYAVAERVFEKLHADDPADPSAAWNLALALAESDDPVKRGRAVELAEASVRSHPESAEAYAVLGWCHRQAGRPADAEKALTLAAAAGEVRLDTAYFMARVLADRGDTAEALTQVTGALQSRGPFAYRADAETLKAELEAKQ